MLKVFDAWDATTVAPDAAQLVAMGYSAVALYVFETSAFKKLLTAEVAQECKVANLPIITIYENGDPTTAAYFDMAKGNSDGHIALARMIEAGMPLGKPVYPTVDFDCSQADYDNRIKPYFAEFRRVVHTGGFLNSAYGNGLLLQNLIPDGLICNNGWLSQSRGFNSYQAGLSLPPAIIQGASGHILNMDIDTDQVASLETAGAWLPG